MSNSTTDKDTTEWASKFIEGWIRIETKDPMWLREAKVDARQEFVTAIKEKLAEVELKARIDENRNYSNKSMGNLKRHFDMRIKSLQENSNE